MQSRIASTAVRRPCAQSSSASRSAAGSGWRSGAARPSCAGTSGRRRWPCGASQHPSRGRGGGGVGCWGPASVAHVRQMSPLHSSRFVELGLDRSKTYGMTYQLQWFISHGLNHYGNLDDIIRRIADARDKEDRKTALDDRWATAPAPAFPASPSASCAGRFWPCDTAKLESPVPS